MEPLAGAESEPDEDALAPEQQPTTEAHETAPFSIYAIDVGQGDSTLIVGPRQEDGKRTTLLMDAGDGGYFGKVRGDKIVGKVLSDLQITSLDYVVMSHFDADHLGGLVGGTQGRSLIWTVSTKGKGAKKKYVDCKATGLFPKLALVDMGPPVKDADKSLRMEWEACAPVVAKENGAEHLRVLGKKQIGTVLDLGGGVTAKIVAGRGWTTGASRREPLADSPNENSVALLVENSEGFSFLVTGDLIGQEYPPGGIEDSALEKALSDGLGATEDQCYGLSILRTGHHGAGNATEATFVKAMCPQVAIISAGDGNKHGHPHCNTLNTLSSAKVPLVLQTETGTTKCKITEPKRRVIVDGTIHVRISGSEYLVRNFGEKSGVNLKPTKVFRYACGPEDCVLHATPPNLGATSIGPAANE